MAKKIFLFSKKIHQILALPMILLIIANKLSVETSFGKIITPMTAVTMIILAVTGGYMWFWMYFHRQTQQKNEVKRNKISSSSVN